MYEFDSEILIDRHLEARRLEIYLTEVIQANSKFSLFSRNLNRADLSLMVAESLIPLELHWIDDKPHIFMDIGSGWGIPAIPLLMAAPRVKFILLEQSQKKADFLKLLLQRLKINAKVINRQLRQIGENVGISGFTLRRVAFDDKSVKAMAKIALPGASIIYFGSQIPKSSFSSVQDIVYKIDRLPERHLFRASLRQKK